MEVGTKFGDFTILGTISTAGGFADIYEAECDSEESVVALKVLRPGADTIASYLFQNEVRVLTQVADTKNPHIVELLGSGQVGDRHFLAMEKLQGDLYSRLTTKPMPTAQATDLVLQVCEALVPVHRLGVVHHDVHPHNMLFDAAGSIKLGDFGIAYSPGEKALGRRLGIDKYLSPEQREMKRSDPRSDQYSLGLTYFQLLTGRQFIRHLSEPMPDPNACGGKDIPPACIAVVKQMISRNINERFASIDQLTAALREVLENLSHQRPSC